MHIQNADLVLHNVRKVFHRTMYPVGHLKITWSQRVLWHAGLTGILAASVFLALSTLWWTLATHASVLPVPCMLRTTTPRANTSVSLPCRASSASQHSWSWPLPLLLLSLHLLWSVTFNLIKPIFLSLPCFFSLGIGVLLRLLCFEPNSWLSWRPPRCSS